MARSVLMVLAFLAAGAAAGPFKLARPDATRAKLASHEDEKVAAAAKKAEAAAREKMSPEEKKAALKEKLAGFDTGEGRSRMYMKMAKTKKFGMPEAEFAKQQQMYGKLAVNEAQIEATKRGAATKEDREEAAFRQRRERALGKVGLGKRGASEQSLFDPDDAPPPAPAGRRLAIRGPSPRAAKALGTASLLAATVAAARVALGRLPRAPPAPAPAPAAPAAAAAADATETETETEAAGAEDGEADAAAEGEAGDGEGEAGGDDPVAAALGYPGMSAEAAARLDEGKARGALLGRLEGQYKIRGETLPLSLRTATSAELEVALDAMRAPAAPRAPAAAAAPAAGADDE